MTVMNKRTICLVLTLVCALTMLAQHYNIVKNIAYTMKTDTYSAQRLKLDIYSKSKLQTYQWWYGSMEEALPLEKRISRIN